MLVIFESESDRAMSLALIAMLTADWLTTAEVGSGLRALERAQYHGFCVSAYYAKFKTRSRKPRICWQLTDSGRRMAQLLASIHGLQMPVHV